MILMLRLFLLCTLSYRGPLAADDPLPSWYDGEAKSAIIQFVDKATDERGKYFIKESDRIAVFDQDGTLWVEQPLYAQMFFALDRIKEIARERPDWKSKHLSLLSSVEQDRFGESTIEEIVRETHAGMTIDEFHDRVVEWLKVSRHPRFKRPFTELVYQPMLEVMEFFKAHGFKVYIVSGGGQEFIRAYSESVYRLTPERIAGTAGKVEYEYRDGHPVLLKREGLLFVDDKKGKPETINLLIGKRPVAAFGNSDGDKEMLEWTGAGGNIHLEVLVHHDDEKREYAYDSQSKIGTFSASLKVEAIKNGWKIVSMKNDWKVIFPWEK